MTAFRRVSLILASGSPRRCELLGLVGLPFEVRAAGIDETPRVGETPVEYARRVARDKAKAKPNSQIQNPNAGALREFVIAADTVVVVDDEILGKPRDADEAAAMLAKLRGRTHEVISAIAVVDAASGQMQEELCRSSALMRDYSDAEITRYVSSGDPLDKAGGYAIQHNGFRPVENFNHCFASVMGLPLCHLVRALRRFNVDPPADVPGACQSFNGYQCPVYREILNVFPSTDGTDGFLIRSIRSIR